MRSVAVHWLVACSKYRGVAAISNKVASLFAVFGLEGINNEKYFFKALYSFSIIYAYFLRL